MRVFPGKPYPLGATFDGTGANFALFSEHAEKVELLLFGDSEAVMPEQVISLKEKTAFIWHVYLPDIKPSQLYAYRVYGPYTPETGHRFNSSKVLIDPYAKAIAGTVKWHDALFGYKCNDPKEDLSFNEQDSSWHVPKSVVIDSSFSWEGDQLLNIPLHQTVIYEIHPKGFTARNLRVDENIRGTYAALATPVIIEYLQKLNITAIELLPVHQHLDEKHLIDKGLTNYWGYNTLGYFAPDFRYSSSGFMGQQVREFKEMVKKMHQAGIEVILDVVYNHSAEGNQFGPTLSFRGIDNISYYYLNPDNLRYYMDFTGCGNSPRMAHPRVTQIIMDSLRYWIQEMHVDGFRFDLASTLAREFYEVDHLASFFDIIQQDPVISQVKLIAEPWDLGEGGYQVGNFPPLWAEWNGRFRDTARRFWKGENGQIKDLGYRLTGSSDLYQDDGRKPSASINFITCHDGFTLSDLVSYNDKHNEANKTDNNDGTDDNISWNCGVEGPADDSEVSDMRLRQQRNFMATLLLSQGVPMILGGDEICRTQQGNNNAYCQDNEISWHDWNIDENRKMMLDFTKKLIGLRRDHPVFHRRKFFLGRNVHDADIKDLLWIRPDGREMNKDDWDIPEMKTIGMLLPGDALDDVDEKGEKVSDETYFMIMNSDNKPVSFKLPYSSKSWQIVVDTCFPEELPAVAIREEYTIRERSFVLLQKNVPG